MEEKEKVIWMYEVFRTEIYLKRRDSLDLLEKEMMLKFEQKLKQIPYSGRPLGYTFFREQKIHDKRLLYLIYEEYQAIFLITITNKKYQQKEIDFVKRNFDLYKQEMKRIISNFKLL